MYCIHDPYNYFEKYVTIVKYYYGNIVTMAKSISLSHHVHVLKSHHRVAVLTVPAKNNKYYLPSFLAIWLPVL